MVPLRTIQIKTNEKLAMINMKKYNISPRSAEFLHAFWKMQRKMMTFVQNTAAKNNLSTPQFVVLMSISHHDIMTQKHIGDKTRLPKSTLSQAIEGLVGEDILERQPVKGNRREMQLSLTPKGKSLVQNIYMQPDGVHQIFDNTVKTMTDQQYSDLMDVYNQITTHLDQEGRDQHAQNT